MLHDPTLTRPAAIAADGWAEALHRDGYCVIRSAIAADIACQLDTELASTFASTPFCQGGFYGARTKRFGRLLSRSQLTEQLVRHPGILAIIEGALLPWCESVQINLTQAIALHPGALPQLPHRDQDMWRGAVGETEYLVNVMWPLTDYTADNGATIVWPDSHGRAALDAEPAQSAVVAEMQPGDALLFLGSTLHGAGGNTTQAVRRGLVVSYCLGWLKPYENQWLAYPPRVAREFSPELAALIGYRQHRPNLGNFEGQCPSILLKGELAEAIGAIDALRPDQAERVAAFVAGQRAA